MYVFWYGYYEWEVKKNDVCLFYFFIWNKKINNKIYVCFVVKGFSDFLWVLRFCMFDFEYIFYILGGIVGFC